MSVKVADAFIPIGGDLAGYQKALKQAETETMGLGAKLKSALKDPLGTIGTKGGPLGALIQDLAYGRSATASFRDAAKGVGTELKNALSAAPGRIFAGGLSVAKGALNELKNLAGQVGRGLLLGLGVGAGLEITRLVSDAVRAIPQLISKSEDYLGAVHEIQEATGATAAAASKLTGVMLELGVPVGELSNRLGRLAVSIQTHEDELNALGVVTRDSNGALLDQVKLLENVRQVFSKTGPDIIKTGQLMVDFGRGALGQVSDYLFLTDAQFKAYAADAQKSGVIVSDAMVEQAIAAERAQARINVSLTGLANTLFASVGPTITSVFDGIAQAITANAARIADVIQQVIGYVVGLVSAISGIPINVGSFSSSVVGMGGAAGGTATQIEELNLELADVDKKLKAGAKSTTGATDAINRQVDALRKLEAAQERTFSREIHNLADVYQKQLDLLELTEKQRDLAQQQQDLNEQLNEAQIALERARRGDAETGIVNAGEVSDALRSIADIQKRQAELAHQQQVDAQRTALENTKAYIESIGQMESGAAAEDRKSLQGTFEARKKILAARLADAQKTGDAQAAAALKSEIAAIDAAEKRNASAIKNAARETALENAKAAAVSATTQALLDQKKQIEATIKKLEEQAKTEHQAQVVMGNDTRHNTDALSGPAGLSQAFRDMAAEGVKAGDQIKKVFADLKDAVGAVGTAISTVSSAFGWFADMPPGIKTGIGLAIAGAGATLMNPGVIAAGLGIAGISVSDWQKQTFGNPTWVPGKGFVLGGGSGQPSDTGSSDSGSPDTSKQPKGGGTGGAAGTGSGIGGIGPTPIMVVPRTRPVASAAGGPRYHPVLSWLAERRPEYVIPDVTDAMARLDALFRGPMPATPGAAGGHATIEIPLYLDGREIARAVSTIQDRQYRS